MPQFTEVSTVNARADYQQAYDSGIHRHGCQDVARAQKFGGCTLYQHEAESAEAVASMLDDDFTCNFGDDHGFVIHIFPCCKELS